MAVSVAEGQSPEALRGQESVSTAGFTGVRALHTPVGSRYFKVKPGTRGINRQLCFLFDPKIVWASLTRSRGYDAKLQ